MRWTSTAFLLYNRPMFAAVLKFAGSLCFLLYGFKLFSEGMQKSLGTVLQKSLKFMSKNRFTAMLTGLLMTMLIQSSSATTIMAVTYVNAGMLSLRHALGVVFGANIGTTVTAWLVALFAYKIPLGKLIIPIFGIGYFLAGFKKLHKESIGQSIMGFGMLFLGLSWLISSVQSATGFTLIAVWLSSHFWAGMAILFVCGIALTALVHSSSAVIAIGIILASNQILSFEMSAMLVIGSNLGTTLNSVIAARNARANAKRTALAHVLFNAVTALLVCIFFKPFLSLADLLIPGVPAEHMASHIAMIHTLFNVLGTAIFLPLSRALAAFTKVLIKEDSEAEGTYRLVFSERTASEAPELCVVQAQQEVGVLADQVVEMFDLIQMGLSSRNQDFAETQYGKLLAFEDRTDVMNEQLIQYLLRCNHLPVSDTTHYSVNMMMQISQDLESMADECLTIGALIKKSIEREMPFAQEDLDRLIPYMELARQLLYFIHKNIGSSLTPEQLEFARELENQIDDERNTLRKIARSRLETGANVKAELLYIDIVRQIEKVGDHCFSVAGALASRK